MSAATLDDAIDAALAAKPDGVLESVASEHGASMEAVLRRLPAGQAIFAPGDAFVAVWQALVGFGDVVFIVHTQDGVFETKATLPEGSLARGYFNVHGAGPLSGHLRADRCKAICFVDRPFFGRRSCSVQFINTDGGVMFKVFVARDAERNLSPEQTARFEALRQSYKS